MRKQLKIKLLKNSGIILKNFWQFLNECHNHWKTLKLSSKWAKYYSANKLNSKVRVRLHWFKNQRKVPTKKGFFPFLQTLQKIKARSHGMKLCTSIKLVSQECIHIFFTYSWGTTIHFIQSSGNLILPIFGVCSSLNQK